MKGNVKVLWLTMVVAGAMLVAGCVNKAPPRVMPAGIASDAAQKALELYDTNKDGVLDAKELEKAPGLRAAVVSIKKVQLTGDQKADAAKIQEATASAKISADEINARFDAWKESKLGRLSLSCRVTHKGNPLAGATVTFVPESFLGSEIKAGTGTTDTSGTAIVSIPTEGSNDPPGMCPGFYRVEITKAGENIPAKYNTDTTLGLEVAGDNQVMVMRGIVFDLDY